VAIKTNFDTNVKTFVETESIIVADNCIDYRIYKIKISGGCEE